MPLGGKPIPRRWAGHSRSVVEARGLRARQAGSLSHEVISLIHRERLHPCRFDDRIDHDENHVMSCAPWDQVSGVARWMTGSSGKSRRPGGQQATKIPSGAGRIAEWHVFLSSYRSWSCPPRPIGGVARGPPARTDGRIGQIGQRQCNGSRGTGRSVREVWHAGDSRRGHRPEHLPRQRCSGLSRQRVPVD